jgi:cytidylate kinase
VSQPVIIAIDGPAASGKGTLARRLADHFGYDFLDTGALYRQVAWHSLDQEMAETDMQGFAQVAQDYANHKLTPVEDEKLRIDEVGRRASIVAKVPDVRAALLDYQKNFAAQAAKGAVLDGRDIGTVICPQADYKFYITADPNVRAQRRLKELQSRGICVTQAQVQAEMQERDDRDAHTLDIHFAPGHKKIVIDTSAVSPNEAFQTVLNHIDPDARA